MREYLLYAMEKMMAHKAQHQEHSTIMSSVAVLVTDCKKAVWGHLGDCRLYVIKNKLITEITSDHTAAFIDYEENETDYNDIRTNPNKNRI